VQELAVIATRCTADGEGFRGGCAEQAVRRRAVTERDGCARSRRSPRVPSCKMTTLSFAWLERCTGGVPFEWCK
jgi:hypothetical protein